MANVELAATLAEIKGAKMVPSFCYMCPWNCPSEVYVKDGKIVYIKGLEGAPNSGRRCAKGEASFQVVDDPDRLKYPMKRVSPKGKYPKFERISWDEAYTIIANKLADVKDKYGPEAVVSLCHHDPNSVFTQILLTQLYGSPNFYSHTAGCEQSRRQACLTVFGHVFPMLDFEESRYIMLWGINLLEAIEAIWENLALFEALDKGAKLVVVDPKFTQTAEKADEWIAIKPGTDGAMALAMCYTMIEENLYDKAFVREWTSGFDEFAKNLREKGYTPEWASKVTDVPAETIRRLAREFATAKPAIAEVFKGPGNYTNGADASRAIYMLNVLTGNVDGPGNICLKDWAPVGPPVIVPEEAMTKPTKPPLHVAMGYPLAPDLPTGLLPKAVINGDPYPVKVLFLHAINLVMSDLNTELVKQMCRELELAVTIDLYMSETALESDLVLPDASFYERAEVRQGLYKAPQAIICQPAIPPVGESQPMYEIVKGIAEKMGYGKYFPYQDWEDWAKVAVRGLPISLDELKMKGIWTGENRHYKFREGGFPTPSGKIEIWSKNFENSGYNPLPEYKEHSVLPDEEYPLQLITSKLSMHCNVLTQNNPYLIEIIDENWVELNPVDAVKYGIRDGDMVVVESPHGKAKIRAKVIEGVKPGVACARHDHGFGHWSPFLTVAYGKGAHLNHLIDSQIDPVSGGNAYNERKVRIRRA
jgi:thiosulfate reductase/polysulfide reductase chain A